jgi:hypothetical protein
VLWSPLFLVREEERVRVRRFWGQPRVRRENLHSPNPLPPEEQEEGGARRCLVASPTRLRGKVILGLVPLEGEARRGPCPQAANAAGNQEEAKVRSALSFFECTSYICPPPALRASSPSLEGEDLKHLVPGPK